MLAISGSVLVSYIRARAEGLGIQCKVGMMQRLERICLITIGILAQGLFQNFYGESQSEGLILMIVFLILAIGTHLTAAHRLIFCYRQLNL